MLVLTNGAAPHLMRTNEMTSQQIRSLSTPALRQVVNGMAFALGHKWADRTARLIAQGEIDRRNGGDARFQ